LPNMLRTFGRTTAKLRAMASDFQKQFNEALKEAELDDVKKSVDQLRGLSPVAEIRKQLNPFEQAAADVRSGVDAAMRPKPAADPATPAATAPQTAEPFKNGQTTMPGIDTEAAATPTFPAMTDESVVTPSMAATPVTPPELSLAERSSSATKPATTKKATKAAPVKAAAKAPAGTALPNSDTTSTQARPEVASSPRPPKPVPAAKPVAPKPVKAAAAAVAPKTVAEAEQKPAAARKPAAKKTAGAAK
jgi:sec-independent protein translocase protein TatB